VCAKREVFFEQQSKLNAKRLVFVDESGFRLGTPPRFGWSPKGKKSPGKTICRLAPNLRPGDTVVMDNLSAHKNHEIINAIHAAGAKVLSKFHHK